MTKGNSFLTSLEKSNKTVFIAVSFAIFGILLFLALALTVPWGK